MASSLPLLNDLAHLRAECQSIAHGPRVIRGAGAVRADYSRSFSLMTIVA
jgi:hypothetical protein